MAIPQIKFVTTPGGLGRQPSGIDHISAVFVPLVSSPVAWAGALGKRYFSPGEAEADGIIEGTAQYALVHYVITEYFRITGPGELWVINASDAAFTAQNVFALTGGPVNQTAWYSATDYAGIAAQVGTIQTFSNALKALYSPSVFITNVKDETTPVNGTAQPDLRALNSPDVSVIIAGDDGGKGATLATATSVKYIPNLGAALGALAAAKVSESIAWVEKFNLATGAEMQSARVSDGTKVSAISNSVMDTLHTKGYLLFRKHVGIAGTYFVDSPVANVATSDFANIEEVRTDNKIKRQARQVLLPQLNGPLAIASDGTLAIQTIKFFESLVGKALDNMQANGEISAHSVFIDPTQNVLTTSLLRVHIEIVRRGVARTIEVAIGYTTSIS